MDLFYFSGKIRIASAGPKDTTTIFAKDNRLVERVIRTWLDDPAPLDFEEGSSLRLARGDFGLIVVWTRSDDTMWLEMRGYLEPSRGSWTERRAHAMRLKDLWDAAGFPPTEGSFVH